MLVVVMIITSTVLFIHFFFSAKGLNLTSNRIYLKLRIHNLKESIELIFLVLFKLILILYLTKKVVGGHLKGKAEEDFISSN